MERVLNFRGTVESVKALDKTIEVKISVNPKWDLPNEEKVNSLKEWITAKVRSSFNVVSMSA
jgi:hypothetical protein